MRDATECINSVGYAFFVVIKAILSNPNGLKMTMNHIQTIVSVNNTNRKQKKKRKETRYSERVLTRNLHDSVQAIHPLCYELSYDLYVHIKFKM